MLVNEGFYSALAAELDLIRVRAGQNDIDKLGLLDDVALGDERISPGVRDGEMVLERVEE